MEFSGPGRSPLESAEIDVADNEGQGNPMIAYNKDGNAVAAWRADNTGNTDDIYAARYDDATHTWSAPTLVHATGIDNTQAIGVAIDDDGAAAIVWGGPTQVNAWITGQTTLMLDPGDPWPAGYKIADTWPKEP